MLNFNEDLEKTLDDLIENPKGIIKYMKIVNENPNASDLSSFVYGLEFGIFLKYYSKKIDFNADEIKYILNIFNKRHDDLIKSFNKYIESKN